jgi:hypothetical protein
MFARLAHADGLLTIAQAQEGAPPLPTTGRGVELWVAYGGGDATVLAVVLLAVAGLFAFTGMRLKAPLAVAPPGRTAAAFMLAIWLLSIYDLCVATFVYGLQLKQVYPDFVAPKVRVGTFIYAVLTFFVVLWLTRRWGWKVALASGVIGTCAAPMLFEFPFDLIIMARTNPPIPTHPMIYRQMFFLPLFLVEFSTAALLTLLPSMRVTAYAAYAISAMFVVFAIWAWFGFAFPAHRLPLTLNVVSKILCFVAAIMLFVWRPDAERADAL